MILGLREVVAGPSDLLGRVALITGAAGGLGRSHARQLADAGARVILTDVSREAAQAAANDIRHARGIAMDIRNERQVREVIDAVAAESGLDIVVNNAGGASGYIAVNQDPVARFRATVELNLIGTYAVCAAALPALRNSSAGRIILTSSSSVFRHTHDVPDAYVAAKAGIVGLTRALARDLGADGITVNCVAPGFTPHEGVRRNLSADRLAAMTDVAVAEQALHRSGTPRDISAAVVFLAGPGAAFVSGQVIVVDGGWTFS